MRYAINAMIDHPAMTNIMRFNFLSLLRCAFLWLSIKSACSGRKSVLIRGAVAPGSELGLRTIYVKGIVTIPTTVRTKNGKNCPWNLSANFAFRLRPYRPVHRTNSPFHSSCPSTWPARPALWTGFLRDLFW